MAFIKAQDIYEATEGGLQIIHRYIPDSVGAESKKKLFRFDAFDTKPSCSLYEHGGIWWVKNHGESDAAMNAIEVVMKLGNCEFKVARDQIALDFGLTAEAGDAPKIRAEYRKIEAPAGTDPTFNEVDFKEFTIGEMKAIFSNQVWSRLCFDKDKKQNTDEHGLLSATRICSYYNFRSLAAYRFAGRDKADNNKLVIHEFRSTDTYPIFCIEEHGFRKIYKPKERDGQYRFMYFGDKPATFLHGLAQHQRKVLETQIEVDKQYESLSEEEQKKSRQEDYKLNEVILLSGGSDALNVAALGYNVVWKNSETDHLQESDYKLLAGLSETLYQLPDLDATGVATAHKLAMEHLDLRTIWLPEWLSARVDWRGNACKDVRDYLRYARKKEFDGLVVNAYPLKFWEESARLDKKGGQLFKKGRPLLKFTPHPVLVMNFLYRNGFARLHAPDQPETTYIHVSGNIVRRVETKDVRQFIRQFLEGRHLDWDLRTAFARTTDLSDGMMEQLPERQLDFADFCPNSQWMFFQNVVWEIRSGSIVEHKPERAGRYVWEHEVIPHQVKLADPAFSAERSGENYQLTLHSTEGTFLRYLILASRVYWRKELEDELDKTSEALRDAYRAAHRFDLSGSLLSELERAEQSQHLLNKLCAFGYLLHRYKDPANAYCVWSTDYTIRNMDESHGGTGKSLAANALVNLMQTETLDGRNPRLTQNPHVFENVTEHTDQLLLDDAQKYIEFEFFFSLITSFMKVNPKGKKGFTIPQESAPKLHITSNFPPLKADSSTQRRIWFMAYSDYFHYNPGGEYRQERRPIDEFGKRFFKEDFGENEWNLFLNLMARCVQAWLKLGKVNPPLDQMMANAYRNKVGSEFSAWADVYFNDEMLNSYVQRTKAFETYKRDVSGQITPQKWHDKLEYWCRYRGYVLNPTGIKGWREDGRITWRGTKEVWQNSAWTRTGERTSLEYIYIQTPAAAGMGMAEPTERGLETDLGGI